MDLALLLHDLTSRSDEFLLQQWGERVVLVQSVEQGQRRCRQIGDIPSWTKAFSIYGAALSADEGTLKEEIVGLWAHMHLINQLSRDHSWNHWLAYDAEFRVDSSQGSKEVGRAEPHHLWQVPVGWFDLQHSSGLSTDHSHNPVRRDKKECGYR